MGSRFFEGLSPADVASLANATIGFLALIVAIDDPSLGARLILLAAVADGVDGELARRFGGSEIGGYLDSLADVASFSVAPAVLVYVTTAEVRIVGDPVDGALRMAIPATFVALGVLRLGVYTAHDTSATATIGAPTTLAASVLAAATLTAHGTSGILLVGCGLLAVAMVSPIGYPDILTRDAAFLGAIHVLALLIPQFYGRVFPYALLTLSLAYLVLGPRVYWGETERELRGPPSPKGKRS